MPPYLVELIKIFVLLWAVIDPLGTIPVYMEATRKFDSATKKRIARNAILVAGGVLLFFVIFGQFVLEAIGVTLEAFQISGGIVLFLFALSMIFGESKPDEEKHLIRDFSHVTVFPIAIPSIASPGALTAVVLLTDNHRFSVFHQVETTLVMFAVLLATYFLLKAAARIQKYIGEAGIVIISKVMGLIIAGIAVESSLAGIKKYFAVG